MSNIKRYKQFTCGEFKATNIKIFKQLEKIIEDIKENTTTGIKD